MAENAAVIRLEGVAKRFTMHLREGAVLPVLKNVSFTVKLGECVALGGPSGIGKSSILKMIYGNYRVEHGVVALRDGEEWVDIVTAGPRRMLALRRTTLGYVSQFLRAIPRVGAFDLVVAAARESGCDEETARRRTTTLLSRLSLPERLWSLPPATFSGGEQQRVNIARGLAGTHPILLLDEPTASLDAASCARVIELIAERRQAKCALLGIFHDDGVRASLANRTIDVSEFAA